MPLAVDSVRSAFPFGELLQVQQLTSGHDQVADRQGRSDPPGGDGDDLEQQSGSAVLRRYQQVGHVCAHDRRRQLTSGVHGEDPAEFAPAGRREPLADARLRQAQ